ncbi:PepSY domain-containing protein [Solibacillus silvestris]|uniref:PepSY domain-containing protein n=1 Tax=Solibacillus silvestris TaxID=76853 RepID=UPI003F7F57FA
MKTKWALLCIAVMVIGLFIAIAVKQLTTSHGLTANEITTQIEQIYNAKVQTLVEQNDSFVASFNKNGSIFEVNVNPVTGHFSKLVLVHKNTAQHAGNETDGKNTPNSEVTQNEEQENETNAKQSPSSNPAITKGEAKQPNSSKPLLSEQQAVNIALKEVPGEVDSVDYENSSDGGSYFIEIEQEDEVTVQVHAITGKILSIQYED